VLEFFYKNVVLVRSLLVAAVKLDMPRNHSSKRQLTHDPVTGVAFPLYVSWVPPNKGRRKTPKYRLKVPDAHCREQGIGSKSAVFPTLSELLESQLYKQVSADAVRHYREGTMKPRRTDAHREASVREYDRLVSEGADIHPDIQFRRRGAIWTVTRTFGTGWSFRATTHSYEDAVLLQRECVNVRSVAEVVGDATTEAQKHKKIPFSRKMLVRLHAESSREDDEEEEEVEVEAVEVVDEDKEDEEDKDEDEDEDEEEDEEDVDVVEDVTVRSSRSGRAFKRPNLYSKEAARPQQGKRRVAKTAAVVGRPVLAVAVDKAVASTAAAAGPSSLGASPDEPIPVYDDADAMQSLKAIRERIAHLL